MYFVVRLGIYFGKLYEVGYGICNDLLCGVEVGLISGGVFGLVIGIVLYVI